MKKLEVHNHQLLNDIYSNVFSLSNTISGSFNEFYYYCNCVYFEKFEVKLNESVDGSIKRVEDVWLELDEMIRRNETSNKKANEAVETLTKMYSLFVEVINRTQNEKEGLMARRNEINDMITQLSQPKKQSVTNILGEQEMKQIEEWTSMKIGNVIFDSKVDAWKQNTSVFDQRILNKSNLIFIIEDDNGNKFGGYVNANILKIGNKFIQDPKAFVFSLKSNGRLKGMMKFNTREPNYSFFLYNKDEKWLFAFGFGEDICVYKENNKQESYCNQQSYNYKGISNALIGKGIGNQNVFSPKRITVLQLN